MIEYTDRRAATSPTVLPALFRREAPISRETIAQWQKEIGQAVPTTEQLSRLVLRWEAGDEWQPIQRFILWQCVDPKHHQIEPWVLADLNGPSPRSTGHYCGEGWCLCDLKKHRWTGGAATHVDQATWELYRDTGLYGQRWWVIQGNHGGHRFQWEAGGVESQLSVLRGGKPDTPSAGDLPYAPFDGRVLPQVLKEKRAGALIRAMQDVAQRKAQAGFSSDVLSTAEQEDESTAKQALWDWIGDRVEQLWQEGGDLLPRYLEEQYGRAPVGMQPIPIDDATAVQKSHFLNQ